MLAFLGCIAGPVILFFILGMIDHWIQGNKTCPSDALIGIICGDLRSNSSAWKFSRQSGGFGYQWVKNNVTVYYSDFMGEACGVAVDEKGIQISPSSNWALLDIVKPLMKNHFEAKRAKEKVDEMIRIIKTSEEMLG